MPGEQYVFYDGSGLSRQNLVTPHAVVVLLEYAWQQPSKRPFRDTLPVAGIDGSAGRSQREVLDCTRQGVRKDRIAGRS